jgi:hypothetical protein
MRGIRLETISVSWPIMKFSAFYRPRTLVSVFTEVRQLSLFWASWIQHTIPSYILKIHINIILSTQIDRSSTSLVLPHPKSTPIPHTCHMPSLHHWIRKFLVMRLLRSPGMSLKLQRPRTIITLIMWVISSWGKAVQWCFTIGRLSSTPRRRWEEYT